MFLAENHCVLNCQFSLQLGDNFVPVSLTLKGYIRVIENLNRSKGSLSGLFYKLRFDRTNTSVS